MIDPYYQKIKIQDERDTINLYARMIGTWKQMIEVEKDDKQKQLYRYWMYLDEIELEAAYEKLTTYRTELDDYERREDELRGL